MGKDTTLNIRVRRKQLEKIKELGLKYIDCWELGYERILENERSELEKLDKKYYNLYTRVHTRLENFGKKLDAENNELDDLLIWYEKQDRSIENPNDYDINTVKLQLRKREIRSFTVDQVFEYWRSRGKKEGNNDG